MKKIILLTCIISLSFASISNEFNKHFRHCQKLFSQGKIDQSIRELKSFIPSGNMEEKNYTYKLLSNNYLAKKDLKNASYYLDLALKNDKNKDVIALNLSNLYIQQKKYNQCIRVLKNTKKQDPNINKNLSFCYFYEKNFPKSIKYAKRYERTNPKDKQILQLLFNANMNINDFKNAIKYFSKLNIKQDEDYFLKLSHMYTKANKPLEGLHTLGYAYEKDLLKSQKALSYYAYLLESNKIYKRAIEVVKSYAPEDKERILNLYIKAKDYKNAVKSLHKRSSDKSKILLAKLYFKMRDFKKCHEILSLKSFSKNSSLQGEAFILKAIALYELKDLKSFEEVLKQALQNKHCKKQARKMLAQVGY